MSQAGQYDNTTVLADIETLTGNSGGAVGPDAAGNVDILGDGTIVTVAGTPASNLLTITVAATVATSYPTDSGTAIPAGNALTVAGGNNVSTSGAASTVTIAVDGNVADSFPTDSGTATPAAGVLTVSGGTGISTSGAGSTVTVTLDTPVSVGNGGSGRGSATAYAVICGGTTSSSAHQSIASVGNSGQVLTSNGGGALPTFQDNVIAFIWNEETGTSATMAVDNGYIANNAALVTLTLPDTAALGSVIRVVGKGAGGWRIAQNAGESIISDSANSTTVGVGGRLDSTDQYDSIEILCTVADTTWTVLSSKGNITIT